MVCLSLLQKTYVVCHLRPGPVKERARGPSVLAHFSVDGAGCLPTTEAVSKRRKVDLEPGEPGNAQSWLRSFDDVVRHPPNGYFGGRIEGNEGRAGQNFAAGEACREAAPLPCHASHPTDRVGGLAVKRQR